MINQKTRNILPPKAFAKRVLKYSVFSISLSVFSLGIGVLGYHYIGNLNWMDSIYNASMILTGMGPVYAYGNGFLKTIRFSLCYF